MTYYYMDMPFPSKQIAQTTMGTISMFAKGNDRYGTASDGSDLRFRSYVCLSQDVNKLQNITNAIDGSKAYIADTGDLYILCSNQWRKYTSNDSMVICTASEYELLQDKTARFYFIVEDSNSETPASNGNNGSDPLEPFDG